MSDNPSIQHHKHPVIESCQIAAGARRGEISMMIKRLTWALLLITVSAGCNIRDTGSGESQSLTPARAAAVEAGVRAFTATVARDVTQEGPIAWSRHFDDSPAFFMAVNGQMAFPNGTAAKEGIQSAALSIKHIELRWGDDLRVDPLTSELAVVAAPWREIQMDAAGHTVDVTGFFTGLAEYRGGHWQFRNAHWSSPVALLPAHKHLS